MYKQEYIVYGNVFVTRSLSEVFVFHRGDTDGDHVLMAKSNNIKTSLIFFCLWKY